MAPRISLTSSVSSGLPTGGWKDSPGRVDKLRPYVATAAVRRQGIADRRRLRSILHPHQGGADQLAQPLEVERAHAGVEALGFLGSQDEQADGGGRRGRTQRNAGKRTQVRRDLAEPVAGVIDGKRTADRLPHRIDACE